MALDLDEILTWRVLDLLSADEFETLVLAHGLLQPERDVRAVRYGRFDFDNLSTRQCVANFRFRPADIKRLVQLLNIPDEIISRSGRVTGLEGLCILLRRLAYPYRLADLEPMFGLSASYLSAIANKVMRHIINVKGHLLTDLNSLRWLDESRLKVYANKIQQKGSPIPNCWSFIEATPRPICRPGVDTCNYYSDQKRFHCVKYQSVAAPDGLIVSSLGPWPGRRHEATIFGGTHFYNQLEAAVKFANGNKYVLYGPDAYPKRELLLTSLQGTPITPVQSIFNDAMSSVQGVEYTFGKVPRYFPYVDFKENPKLRLQDMSSMYQVSVLMTNCHTCLYGGRTSEFFDLMPVPLDVYLG